MRVLGYRVQSGVSQKGAGSKYEMATICISVAVEQMNVANTRVYGAGGQGLTMPLNVEAIPQFEKLKFPKDHSGLDLDILTDQAAVFGELKTVCVGVRGTAALSKVG